jgi:hypothetical protein
MRNGSKAMFLLACTLAVGSLGLSQSAASPAPGSTHKKDSHVAKRTGPGKQMGNGGKDIGVGVAKGTGSLAKGTAGGVGNLARGNFGGAGASLGKGAGGMGKNVGVGTVKGTAKIGKGVGRELKKL